MNLGRYLWRAAAITTIVIGGLSIALLLTSTDGGIFLWPAWLLIALSLWLAVGELRRK
jgi:FtsH-binding integral membrane protein